LKSKTPEIVSCSACNSSTVLLAMENGSGFHTVYSHHLQDKFDTNMIATSEFLSKNTVQL
jgi:hypothetical protein